MDSFAASESAPVLPLALNAEIVLPIDLESPDTVARRRRRLLWSQSKAGPSNPALGEPAVGPYDGSGGR